MPWLAKCHKLNSMKQTGNNDNNKTKQPVEFAQLESDPVFRADYLFFLQQANSYLVAIFWDVFNDGKKCKQITHAVRNLEKENDSPIDAGLKKSLFSQAGKQNMDVFKADFIRLLEAFPNTRKAAFAHKLRLIHVIPLPFSEFVQLVSRLKEKRHFLEHYDERRAIGDFGPDNEKVLSDLGLLLIPALSGLFLGAVNRALSRAGARNNPLIEDVRKIFFQSTEHRKDGARAANSDLRAKANMVPHKRLAAELHEEKWHKLYLKYFPHGQYPRYKHMNFKLRVLFIGEPRIEQICSLLDESYARQQAHFRNEIEAVYEITMRINVFIHTYLYQLAVPKKKWPKQIKALRNHVAHNGFFWAVPNIEEPREILSVEGVFQALFALSSKCTDGRYIYWQFRTQIKDLLSSQKYSLAYPLFFLDQQQNRVPIVGTEQLTPAPKTIRYWSVANRHKYLNPSQYRVDKRLRVNRLFGNWLRAMQTPEQNSISEQKTGQGTRT